MKVLERVNFLGVLAVLGQIPSKCCGQLLELLDVFRVVNKRHIPNEYAAFDRAFVVVVVVAGRISHVVKMIRPSSRFDYIEVSPVTRFFVGVSIRSIGSERGFHDRKDNRNMRKRTGDEQREKKEKHKNTSKG